MCMIRILYGSVSDPNGPALPDMTNDQGLGGDANLDLSYVDYDWQLCTSDYRFINKPFVTYAMKIVMVHCMILAPSM